MSERREIDINILGRWAAVGALILFVIALIMGYGFGI